MLSDLILFTLYKVGTIVTFILFMKKPRHREVETYPQDHTARKN